MTYLIDTAVLAELMSREPAAEVVTWLCQHERLGLAVSAMAMAELQAGLGRLPPDQRNRPTRWVLALERAFDDQVLPFDMAAARVCARVIVNGEAEGAPPPMGEAMLAGIAEANGLVLAARPTPHLTRWGGRMVDPWATMVDKDQPCYSTTADRVRVR